MAQQILNNGDLAPVFRGKLNSMFTELYNAISGATGGWVVDSEDIISPVNNRDVSIGLLSVISFSVNDNFIVSAIGAIKSVALSANINYNADIGITSGGDFFAKLLGALPSELSFANKTLNAGDYALYATASGSNIIYTLPDGELLAEKAYLIRKASGAYNVIINKTGNNYILVGGTLTGTIQLTNIGDWVLLRCNTNDFAQPTWVVEANGQGGGESGITARQVKTIDDDYSVMPEDAAVIGGNTTKNIEVGLPEIDTVGAVDTTFRKTVSGAYAFTIVRAGTDNIEFDGNTYTGITTITTGAWIRIISDTENNSWHVIAGGTNWATI